MRFSVLSLLPLAASGVFAIPALQKRNGLVFARTEDPCRIVSNYTVVSGDTLTTIAKEENTSVDALVYVNQIPDRDLILVGQVLQIPCSDCQPCRTVGNYTVVQGDTLNAIAKEEDTTAAAIYYVNMDQITNPNFIYPGENLKIPSSDCNTVAPPLKNTTGTATCVDPTASNGTYTVVQGNTLTIIADNYGITLEALEKANPQIPNFDEIEIGQVINIPVCSATCVDSSKSDGTYTVVSGDTLSKIADSYGITLKALEDANSQIENFDSIAIGQKINIPIC